MTGLNGLRKTSSEATAVERQRDDTSKRTTTTSCVESSPIPAKRAKAEEIEEYHDEDKVLEEIPNEDRTPTRGSAVFEITDSVAWRWAVTEDMAPEGDVPIAKRTMCRASKSAPNFKEAKRQMDLLKRQQRPGTEASAHLTNLKNMIAAKRAATRISNALPTKPPNLAGDGVEDPAEDFRIAAGVAPPSPFGTDGYFGATKGYSMSSQRAWLKARQEGDPGVDTKTPVISHARSVTAPIVDQVPTIEQVDATPMSARMRPLGNNENTPTWLVTLDANLPEWTNFLQ